MDAWPVSLQQKLNVENFEYKPGETRVATEMDVGPPKVRSRFTNAVDSYSCTVNLDFAEVQTFKDFYKTNLGNGTLPFTFPDPFTGVDTAFVFATGTTPSIVPIGGRIFTLSMNWEFVP